MGRRLRHITRLALALMLCLGAAPQAARAREGAPASRFFPARDLMRVGVYYYPEHWLSGQCSG